ncbi:hypothetical protein ANN_19968 [Periplaneta americana]|uniref:Uncharacterized protein n=1 Tax=Periplaneta americana TaxID=6978 RepID=A0ABQ8SC01_PERAM|nr:hypothetical protein ANN_19968 [Periplaneta americana]
MRRLYGAVKDRGIWRARTNQELGALYHKSGLVSVIKMARACAKNGGRLRCEENIYGESRWEKIEGTISYKMAGRCGE